VWKHCDTFLRMALSLYRGIELRVLREEELRWFSKVPTTLNPTLDPGCIGNSILDRLCVRRDHRLSAAWCFNFGLNKKGPRKAEIETPMRLKWMVSGNQKSRACLG